MEYCSMSYATFVEGLIDYLKDEVGSTLPLGLRVFLNADWKNVSRIEKNFILMLLNHFATHAKSEAVRRDAFNMWEQLSGVRQTQLSLE